MGKTVSEKVAAPCWITDRASQLLRGGVLSTARKRIGIAEAGLGSRSVSLNRQL